MLARRYQSRSEEETIEIGRQIARELPRKAVVLLIGNLGAGKTTLTKGIAEELGGVDPNDVTSPTFTLIHEYGRSVYHIDLYRLDTAAEVRSLGLEDLFDRDAVVLIEWGERFLPLMPPERVEVRISTAGTEREISVQRVAS